MRTIFDEAKRGLPEGKKPTLEALREVAPEVDAAALLASFRASVARLAFEDDRFEAACWGCGERLKRSLVGLTCTTCHVVVPVEERPGLPRYVFGARIAQGGQGTVWKALYEPLADWRAVKAIPLLDQERESRIRDEARAANALKHPRIPTVHDVVRDDDTVYIAMEWIEGETLESARSPSVRDALEWLRLAAEGIGVAHARGLVHRDVKPGNVMRSPEGGIKVVDFGLALPIAESAGATGPEVRKAGVAGTPAYMAPEVARGEPATTRSDVWSLGATLHRVLTGRAPVERAADESPEDYLERRGQATARGVGPPEVAAVVTRCLELEPARRYADASALALDLARCLDGRPVVAYRESLSPPRGWFYSLGRHVDRNPVASIVAVLLVIAAPILLFALGSLYGGHLALEGDREVLERWHETLDAHRASWRHDRSPEELERIQRRALSSLDELVARRPYSAASHATRARAKRWLGDLAGADADLRRARELLPRSSGELFALVLLERAEDLDQARAALGGPRDVAFPEDERVVLEALALARLDGKTDEARARLEAAQAKEPSAELCLALARLATSADERARWREAGLAIAPGDVRLRALSTH